MTVVQSAAAATIMLAAYAVSIAICYSSRPGIGLFLLIGAPFLALWALKTLFLAYGSVGSRRVRAWLLAAVVLAAGSFTTWASGHISSEGTLGAILAGVLIGWCVLLSLMLPYAQGRQDELPSFDGEDREGD